MNKEITDGVYPQTNYTTQRFYTKEEYERLQQENEKLKQVANDSIIEQEKLIAKVNELQAENEKLKEEKQELSIEIVSLTSKLFTLEKSSNDLSQGVNKLYQTLQEIRELIKKLDLSLGCAYGDYDCDNCSDINEKTVCKIKLQNIIIDKINSVIGAE